MAESATALVRKVFLVANRKHQCGGKVQSNFDKKMIAGQKAKQAWLQEHAAACDGRPFTIVA